MRLRSSARHWRLSLETPRRPGCWLSARKHIASNEWLGEMYYAFIRTTPGVLNLWTGSAYNQVLAQLSTEDSQRTARILYDASLPFLSPAQVQRALPGF